MKERSGPIAKRILDSIDDFSTVYPGGVLINLIAFDLGVPRVDVWKYVNEFEEQGAVEVNSELGEVRLVPEVK